MNRVAIERSVLSANDRVAVELRNALDASGALALNFISSPGSGKTALLEETLKLRYDLGPRMPKWWC
jgi:hydrogenase nickel incorporation protein HypB